MHIQSDPWKGDEGAGGARPRKWAGKECEMITEAGVIGFLKMLVELFVKERNVLKAAGLDVESILATLRNLLEQASAAEQQQEALKRASKAGTEAWLAIKRTAYVTGSGCLDMAIAAVKKDSDAARNFRKIRTNLYKARKDAKIQAVPAKA